jgi:hypothetical protein
MANSPEEVGEWEITTERGPNAFAQFRLQENVNVLVIEHRGILVASCSFTHRNVLVAGQKFTVRYGQALRVRREYRRMGYGDQVRSLSWGVGAARPSNPQYDIMRTQNFAVVNWWEKYVLTLGRPEKRAKSPASASRCSSTRAGRCGPSTGSGPDSRAASARCAGRRYHAAFR